MSNERPKGVVALRRLPCRNNIFVVDAARFVRGKIRKVTYALLGTALPNALYMLESARPDWIVANWLTTTSPPFGEKDKSDGVGDAPLVFVIRSPEPAEPRDIINRRKISPGKISRAY